MADEMICGAGIRAAKSKRRKLLLISVIVLCMVLAGAYVKLRMSSAPSIASWSKLQADLKLALQSGMYQQGKKAIQARPVSKDNTQEIVAADYYLTVEFARTLTEKQLETIHKAGNLPFTQLSSSQQVLLSRRTELALCKQMREQIKNSCIIIPEYPKLGGGSGVGCDWRVPTADGKGTSGVFNSIDPMK